MGLRAGPLFGKSHYLADTMISEQCLPSPMHVSGAVIDPGDGRDFFLDTF